MSFKFSKDQDYGPLSNKCTLFKVINDIEQTPDGIRSKIFNKLIEEVNTRICKRIRHDNINNPDEQINKLIEDEQVDVNNDILDNARYCNVLLYDINEEGNTGFTLTSLIDKEKWGPLTTDEGQIILGYAIVRPLDKKGNIGLEFFEIFLEGHNLGELFYTKLKETYSPLWVCSLSRQVMQYWIKMGLYDDMMNLIYHDKNYATANIPLRHNEHILYYCYHDLRWEHDCINHIIRLDELVRNNLLTLKSQMNNLDLESPIVPIIPLEYHIDLDKETEDYINTLSELHDIAPEYFKLGNFENYNKINQELSNRQQFSLAKEFLLRNFNRAPFPNKLATSYRLKHYGTSWYRKYNSAWVRKVWNTSVPEISSKSMVLALFKVGFVYGDDLALLKEITCPSYISSRQISLIKTFTQ